MVSIKRNMEIAKRLKGVGEYYFSQKLREIDNINKKESLLLVWASEARICLRTPM